MSGHESRNGAGWSRSSLSVMAWGRRCSGCMAEGERDRACGQSARRRHPSRRLTMRPGLLPSDSGEPGDPSPDPRTTSNRPRTSPRSASLTEANEPGEVYSKSKRRQREKERHPHTYTQPSGARPNVWPDWGGVWRWGHRRGSRLAGKRILFSQLSSSYTLLVPGNLSNNSKGRQSSGHDCRRPWPHVRARARMSRSHRER